MFPIRAFPVLNLVLVSALDHGLVRARLEHTFRRPE